MARQAEIYCTVCKQKAVIKRTERVAENGEFSRLYCTCKNPACNHKFVMNLEFSHTTSASLLAKDELIAHLISRLSPADKMVIFNQLKTQQSRD